MKPRPHRDLAWRKMEGAGMRSGRCRKAICHWPRLVSQGQGRFVGRRSHSFEEGEPLMSVTEVEVLDKVPANEALDFGDVVDVLTSASEMTEEDAILLVHEAIADGILHLTGGFLVTRVD